MEAQGGLVVADRVSRVLDHIAPTWHVAGLDQDKSNRILSLAPLYTAAWQDGPSSRVTLIWHCIADGRDPSGFQVAGAHPDVVLCLWVVALQRRNSKAYHFLTLLTPRHVIQEALDLAVQFRVTSAAMALLAQITRVSVDPLRQELAGPVFSDEMFLQSVIHGLMDLPYVFEPLIEPHIINARALRQGPVWKALCHRASKRWSLVASSVLMVVMWKRYVAYLLRPDGPLVQRRAQQWGRSVL